jgi:polyhydroxyalkanoate synthase
MISVYDLLRRGRAAWLRSAGFGSIEMPPRAVYSLDGLRLRIYGEGLGRPALLIVPAPIKRAYIWDLMPGRSVVRHAVWSGLKVGLIEWADPERESASRGLDDYAYLAIGSAVAAMLHRFRARRLLLAGHSLGGTLAAIFAALHPRVVRGLLLLEAPLRFGPGAGALGSLAALASWVPDASRAGEHRIPGSLISALGVAADPVEFLTGRWLDGLACAADPEALAAHLRVVHWALDELAMPGRLFGEMTARLCRDDQFHRGVLRIAGRHAAPRRLDMPVLAVLDPGSRLVPPRSVLSVLQAAGGVRTLYWHREEAAGSALRHVGALVGSNAHRYLWPRIVRWSHVVWEGKRIPGCCDASDAGRRLA